MGPVGTGLERPYYRGLAGLQGWGRDFKPRGWGMAREKEFGEASKTGGADSASTGDSRSEGDSLAKESLGEDPPPPPPRSVPGEGETFGRISIAMSSFAGSGKGQKVSQSDIPAPGSQKKK